MLELLYRWSRVFFRMEIGDRVKLPISLDLKAMQLDVRALGLHDYVEYSPVPLTAPHALPQSTKVRDYADGSWAEWRDTTLLEDSAYLLKLIGYFRSKTTVTLVRLLRLAPGGYIAEHTDPTLGLEQKDSVIRLTIPILSNPKVAFYLNGRLVPMHPGECWYLRFTDPHEVVNAGASERINLSIDLIPNRWVRSWIEKAATAKH